MRLVIDTNVLISALLGRTSLPAHLLVLWRRGRFGLLSSAAQIDEIMRVTRYPKLRERLDPVAAGRLVNEVRDLAVLVPDRSAVGLSPDPFDDYLLAMADVGAADFIVTGDKRDLLSMKVYKGTKIVTTHQFLALDGHFPRSG